MICQAVSSRLQCAAPVGFTVATRIRAPYLASVCQRAFTSRVDPRWNCLRERWHKSSSSSLPQHRAFSLDTHVERIHASIANLEQELQSLKGEVSLLKNNQAEILAGNTKRKTGLFALLSEYGLPFALWYGVLWAGGIGGLYGAVQLGYIGWDDAKESLNSLGMGQFYDLDQVDPKTGSFVVAFLLNEFLEPIRLPLAIATIKPLVKLMKR